MVSELYPGKTFDYIATNRPILNYTKPSGFAKLIEECSIGVSVDGNNPITAAKTLIEWYDCTIQGKSIMDYDLQAIERFNAKNLAKSLATILNTL